ncbi:MAG: alpha-amylase family glycosyl hydrolase, partial [Melioribacteraceae bacterium]|nr:alpha-amylase family glycosyl hydrolase [Melioribacteraceae bacterium]
MNKYNTYNAISSEVMMNVKHIYFCLVLLLPFFLSCDYDSEKDLSQSQTKFAETAFADVPAWSKEVIWYQIFVERFRNGDPNNDPTPVDLEGTYPGIIPESWTVTPWTQDWHKPDPYFAELNGKKDFLGNEIVSFGQKSQLRRYGGDLQGVLDKMDYLESLGVTAIYFNPLNDAPSLHKYDARHWRHIDRNFGPNPRKDVETMSKETPDDPSTWKFTEADKLFLKVIGEFHKRGIKIILDFSWNHTGHTFWAFKDLVKNQKDSKYADWYWIKKFDDPNTPENEFEYRGWFGVAELPEIKETEYHDHLKYVSPFDGDIVDESAKEHIFNISRRWLDPNNDGDPSDGVDGFRLDVAAELPLSFWKEYRKNVRDVNPNAYLIGEVW